MFKPILSKETERRQKLKDYKAKHCIYPREVEGTRGSEQDADFEQQLINIISDQCTQSDNISQLMTTDNQWDDLYDNLGFLCENIVGFFNDLSLNGVDLSAALSLFPRVLALWEEDDEGLADDINIIFVATFILVCKSYIGQNPEFFNTDYLQTLLEHEFEYEGDDSYQLVLKRLNIYEIKIFSLLNFQFDFNTDHIIDIYTQLFPKEAPWIKNRINEGRHFNDIFNMGPALKWEQEHDAKNLLAVDEAMYRGRLVRFSLPASQETADDLDLTLSPMTLSDSDDDDDVLLDFTPLPSPPMLSK